VHKEKPTMLIRQAQVVLAGMTMAALAWVAPAAAQTKPKVTETGLANPASAIFIGNSFFYYNNGIHSMFSGLVRAADPGAKVRATMVTISGSGADWHDVGSYFRPGAIGRYSFDAGNNVVFNKIDRLFDVAILMDCSQCPVHPELKSVFTDYMKKHAETVRRHGTMPVLFMSWAYADKPEMTEGLAEAYTQAGNDNGALVIPAGLAFARAVKQLPEVGLYAPDKRHPSLAGSYLAAATVYAALLKQSPVGLGYTAGLDASTAKALQSIAWDTVQDYYGTAITSK
jgi:hypothetical protein